MFRRHWSALPKDPIFPSTLEGLGYFINEKDEIRSIENPDCYFKYLINRNERVNNRQRFHFNMAMEDIIHQRLEQEGVVKLVLPLGTAFSEPHIPIFVSPDWSDKERIVLIVSDTMSSLGMISCRVANGPGGLNQGSAVSLVRNIREQLPSAGIILANPGALHWWPEGGRTLSGPQAEAAPSSSIVSYGKKLNEAVNRVTGHESDAEHLKRLFEMIKEKGKEGVKVQVFGIEKGAELIERVFDDEEVWGRWGGSLECMVLFGTHRDLDWMHLDAFKAFLAKRCRCYSLSSEPLNTPLSGPQGNPSLTIPPLGLPVYSSSEEWCAELMAVTAQTAALSYLAEVAGHEDFSNPEVVPPVVVEDEQAGETNMSSWDDVKEEDKPWVEVVSEEKLQEQRMWNRWEETGMAELDDLDVQERSEIVPRAAPAA